MIEGDDEDLKLAILGSVYEKIGGRVKMPTILAHCQQLYDFAKNAKPTKKKRPAPEGEKVVKLHPHSGKDGVA